MSGLKQTPLHALHTELGARMVDFAGYSMPVQYGSILEEHRAVREAAGLFDVSHMGQLHFDGAEAAASLERLLTCRVDSLAVGAVRYGLLCNDEGGVVDDVTLYRTGDEAFFLCVNAANIRKDWDWIARQVDGACELEDRSDAVGMLALQGPCSAEILEAAGGPASALALERFRCVEGPVGDASSLISRTGYTGSDGFEIYASADAIERICRLLLERGESLGLRPAGLGARDTLRLEAALPLYGHELDDTTSPLNAGLGRFVKRKRGGFIGAEAIERLAREDGGPHLVGFALEARGIARAGLEIAVDGTPVGRVTSGAPSPTLGKSIGLGYVPDQFTKTGTALDIVIRNSPTPARVVDTPFVG